jgi:hypothetical protein
MNTHNLFIYLFIYLFRIFKKAQEGAGGIAQTVEPSKYKS